MTYLGFDTASLKYLAASFVATYCSGLTHPLDVIKTRLQSRVSKYTGHDGKGSADNLVPKYRSVRGAFKEIYQS
jgi:hypothetical protein